MGKKNIGDIGDIGDIGCDKPKIYPTPIRFIESEITNLNVRKGELIDSNREMIIKELGSLNHINNTKLIRAAVLLLKDVSDKKLIKAIRQVQINMSLTTKN